MYAVFMENPLSKYIIRPTFSLTGRVISYIIPSAIKSIPSNLYKKFVGNYSSEEFANALVEMKVV